jgi:hypothetical protein
MATQIKTQSSPERPTGVSARSSRTAGAATERARLTKWFVVEDVTVSVDDSTPGYRVMTDAEIEPFPEAWLAVGEGFDSREAADAALIALRAADEAGTSVDETR